MDGGWASNGQKFKRRILDVSVHTDPFNITSNGMYLKLTICIHFININIYFR